MTTNKSIVLAGCVVLAGMVLADGYPMFTVNTGDMPSTADTYAFVMENIVRPCQAMQNATPPEDNGFGGVMPAVTVPGPSQFEIENMRNVFRVREEVRRIVGNVDPNTISPEARLMADCEKIDITRRANARQANWDAQDSYLRTTGTRFNPNPKYRPTEFGEAQDEWDRTKRTYDRYQSVR